MSRPEEQSYRGRGNTWRRSGRGRKRGKLGKEQREEMRRNSHQAEDFEELFPAGVPAAVQPLRARERNLRPALRDGVQHLGDALLIAGDHLCRVQQQVARRQPQLPRAACKCTSPSRSIHRDFSLLHTVMPLDSGLIVFRNTGTRRTRRARASPAAPPGSQW